MSLAAGSEASKAFSAQARSQGRLKQFLDEDAGLAVEQVETLHDFMIDWFRLDAAPELATATATTYLHVYNKHLRPLAGHRPLEEFELPGPVTKVLGQMAAAGVGQPTREHARKVLSSAFGWGVEMGRMRANGARSVRRNRRRSRRLTAAHRFRRCCRRPLHARAAAQLHPRRQAVRSRRRRLRPGTGVPHEGDAVLAAPGPISLRVLAGEDIKRIADDCGTSTAMIHRHYLHELDMRHEKPQGFSFDGAVEAALRAVRGARAA